MNTLKLNTFGNEKQKQCYKYLLSHPEITEIGYGGGAGGGKSYTGVSWIWMMCNRYAGVRYFFGRQELKRLKQTTLATYFKFLSDYNIPESQKGVYNAQDSAIRFSNGSEILLLDLAYLPSDPLYTRFGSLELTGGFIDESAEIDEQCVSILSTRVGRQKNDEYGLSPKILEGFNPDKGHVYRRFYIPSKNDSLPEYRVFIKALATDNKRLPKSYIEQLMKTNEVTRQRLLYGNFDYDDTPGRLFEYNDLLNIFSKPLEQEGDCYISIDVARKGKDKTVIAIWRGLSIIELLEEDKSNILELSDRIKELAKRYNVNARRIIADEDGVGGGLVDSLRCQGFINNSKPRQRRNPNLSTIRNFDNLKTQCYFELARNITKVAICQTASRNDIIEELDVVVQTKLDSDTKVSIIKKEDIKAKIGRSPDYSDAIMMRMFFELDKMQPLESEKEEEQELTKIDLIFEEEEYNEEEELGAY